MNNEKCMDMIELYNDCIRFSFHILVIHLLSCIIDDEVFFDTKTLKLILFSIISIMIYYLIIKKRNIFFIKYNKKNK